MPPTDCSKWEYAMYEGSMPMLADYELATKKVSDAVEAKQAVIMISGGHVGNVSFKYFLNPTLPEECEGDSEDYRFYRPRNPKASLFLFRRVNTMKVVRLEVVGETEHTWQIKLWTAFNNEHIGTVIAPPSCTMASLKGLISKELCERNMVTMQTHIGLAHTYKNDRQLLRNALEKKIIKVEPPTRTIKTILKGKA